MTTSNETGSIVDNEGDEFTTQQLAQMFNTGMTGETKAADPVGSTEGEKGATPGAPAAGDVATSKQPDEGQARSKEPGVAAKEEGEQGFDPANTVILAKDRKHTIDFSHLEKAREQRDSFKAEAEEAKRQLAELQAQAQARAEAGKQPTQQDQLVQQAQEAIDKGIDPSIFGDYSEEALAKGFAELSRRTAEAVRAQVREEVLQEVRAEIAPLIKQSQQDAATAHVNTILQAHPDIASVLESTEFAEWMGKQPSYVQEAMAAVLDNGSAKQVVEVLDSYKASTQSSQKTSQAPSPQAAAQKVVDQLKTPVPNSPSEIPGGHSGPGTLAERLQAMSEVDLFNALNSGEISQEQLNRYLSRKS